MASKLDEAIAALVAVLSADDPAKPAGLTVGRGRALPHNRDDLKHIGVYPGAEVTRRVGNQLDSPLTKHDTVVLLELRAVVPEELSFDQALDPLYVWAIVALMRDDTLGGVINELQELGRDWDLETRDQEYGGCWVKIQIGLQNRTDNPELRT